MAREEEPDAEETLLGATDGTAVAYVLKQLNTAIGYYDRAGRRARGASLQYVAIARTCYVVSGLIMAVTVAGVWEHVLVDPNPATAFATAGLGLPLSAPKWSVGILAVGYLLSQYGQRRGFTRGWTRYADTEQRLRALKRQFAVDTACAGDDAARAQLCIGAVTNLNALVADETQRWARDIMLDFDRIHALLQEGSQKPNPGEDCPERRPT